MTEEETPEDRLRKACDYYCREGRKDSLDAGIICIWSLLAIGCVAIWYKFFQIVGIIG